MSDRGPVEFHVDAVLEAQAARRWYAERSPAAGEAFLDELDRAVEAIRESPDAWPRFGRETRKYVMRRFPFLVVYRRRGPETIQVIAVAHGRRRPGYWRDRES